MVRVKDVARVELGAQDYTIIGRLNGKPSAIMAVYQLPGTNAVEAAAGRAEADGGGEEAFSAGHGLRDLARHDASRSRRA